ncbi:MGH1-like glycoside hydrolase domain-containing protein [Pedobacter africanus]|uniref:Trehalase n=1 Tax=Pedobacter africanus TaxID=151894 RepID=A0A1W2EFY4_9SPHI|nr:trehalase family glycosidase [Pedobacter africanus]SMD08577.1 Trehalase [Pedobacter africanus]
MKVLFKIIVLCLPGLLFAQQKKTADFAALNNTHDMLLSAWGPYSKRYAGISHIPEFKSGIRFDFSVFPGLYRYKPSVPHVLLQSDYFPWKSNDDLTKYTFRHELLWKDEAYADVTYEVVDSSSVLVAVRCVNNTALPQNMDVNLMAYLDYPENYPLYGLHLGKGSFWINALEYQSLKFAKPGPRDNLVYDGWLAAEVRNEAFIDGRGMGAAFSSTNGNRVNYQIPLTDRQLEGKLILFYRMKKGTSQVFRTGGLAEESIRLKGTGNLEQVSIAYRADKAGLQAFWITSEAGDVVEFNGFALVPSAEPLPEIVALEKQFTPEVKEDMDSKTLVLKYKEIANYYGIAWDDNNARIREFKNDELDYFFRRHVNNQTHQTFVGNNKGNFANVYIRPVELDAHEEKTIYALLCKGDYEQVKKGLGRLHELKQKTIAAKAGPLSPELLPGGEKYAFSQQILKATLMTNIMYPVYTQNSYIRHFTPGKWYNSLYTWDSGFIAVGLNEISAKLAAECINVYTTGEDNQNAFIQHGTPYPVQIYAFFDLWNKTQSREALAYFYPRLKRYYEFMAGRYGSSTTRALKSNMLTSWDYFYNSGGWDDYPAQVTVHEQKGTKKVAAAVNNAYSIRIAKMLRMAAIALKKDKDLAAYDADIKQFAVALQQHSWNENSGYFSYVLHDEQGNPTGHFKDPLSGEDHNMGLDGAYPLFAGICTPAQEARLLEKIFSEKHMWTPSGICVVDQSAPYFKPVGYWNGSVWMPHQWFTWKAMLDLGRFDLAQKIAFKGLDVFKKEVDNSYATFEYFSAKTGRGAGWHQFGGLSAPVLSWFSAYFKPGTVTTGFEIWIKDQEFNVRHSAYKANLSFDQATVAHARSLMVCMNPAFDYEVLVNGKAVQANVPYAGLLQISLPASNKDVSLIIQPMRR